MSALVSALQTDVTIKATYSWKLIFSIDNSNSKDVEFERTVTITGSKKINTKTHRDALVSSVQDSSFTSTVGANVSATIGPVTASTETSATWANSSTLTKSLQEVTDSEKETTSTVSDTLTFKVGAESKMKLYQLVLSAPGFYEETATISTDDSLPVLNFDVVYTLRPKYKLVKDFTVVYAEDRISQPAGCLTEFSGRNNDINDGKGGQYTYIVPSYTYNPAEALTNLSVIIQNTRNNNFVDMAKGTEGDVRYLLPSKQEGFNTYITEPSLLRSSDPLSDYGKFTGHTIDINDGRKETYLYIVWKTVTL